MTHLYIYIYLVVTRMPEAIHLVSVVFVRRVSNANCNYSYLVYWLCSGAPLGLGPFQSVVIKHDV